MNNDLFLTKDLIMELQKFIPSNDEVKQYIYIYIYIYFFLIQPKCHLKNSPVYLRISGTNSK